ncbi:MAG: hypothetical protein M1822_000719 [Bathelium mastoideum]|nr:MAG: hypothetical protein M1822_000719 [Bathelium mastoideum]
MQDLGLAECIKTVLVVGLAAALIIVFVWQRQNRYLRSMDGPRGYPLIGVGLSLPSCAPEILRDWARQYGDVFKMRVGLHTWVVINSPEAFKEILDKQSISTSSKVPLPYGHDIVTKGLRMFTMSYGPKWRTYRTMTHQLLSTQMTLTFIPSQEHEVKQLMYELANENANERDFYFHVRRMSMSIISTSTLGRRIDSKDHIDIQRANESLKLLGKITRAGAFIEDELPLLLLLPQWLQPSYKKATEYATVLLNAKLHVWNRLKEDFRVRSLNPCFGKELIGSDYGSKGLTEADAAWIVGGLVEAGSETTSVTLLNLILYLTATPSAQSLANEELSRVVGDYRPPNFEDIHNLPYIRACVKEILRLCPIPPFGIKHYADRDIIFNQHRIPKGTVLLANTMAIHFDPARYDEPHSFKPERYMDHPRSSAEYAASADPCKRDHFTFGAGRRICPGIRLAENTLNIAAANLLWAFELRPPLVIGEDGMKREGVMDLSDDAFETSAAFRPPKPYRVRFVPRSESKAKMLTAQWEREREKG